MGRVWAGLEKVGGEREDSRQTGSALRCRGCAALEAALCRGHRRLTPSPLGSQSRGCDGGTAAAASPGVGTVGPWCCRHGGVTGLGGGAGRWIFCRALGGGVQSLAKVRVKGSVAAGDGLAVDGHASTSLEISSRSALAVWGWRIGKQQSWCVGRGELLPGFVVGGFCFCRLGFLVASPLGGDSAGSRLQTRLLLSGLLAQFRAGLIIIKMRMKGVVVLWLFSAFYEQR